MTGWDISCYIFGAIAIVGPLFIIVWYFQEAHKRVKELNRDKK